MSINTFWSKIIEYSFVKNAIRTFKSLDSDVVKIGKLLKLSWNEWHLVNGSFFGNY